MHVEPYKWDRTPLTLGKLLVGLREGKEMSKYEVEHRGGVNHWLVRNLENGTRLVAEYPVLMRIADGLDASQRERLDILDAALVDRITVETAKYAVYYLGVSAAASANAREIVEGLREELCANLEAEAENRRQRGQEVAGDPLVIKVRERIIDVRTASGVDLFAAIAEYPDANQMRLDMLYAVMEGVTISWSSGRSILRWRDDAAGQRGGDSGPADDSPAAPPAGSPPPQGGGSLRVVRGGG